MEATTTARIVGHDIDLTRPQYTGPSETGERILEVLRKAQVRTDRHMTRERIAQELGAFRGGCATIYKSLDAMAKVGRVTERLDLDCGETTYHLPTVPARSSAPGLFDRMVQSAPSEAPKASTGPYKCPYCPEETRTERGRNIHIGLVHKGKDQVPVTPQASCSAPKSAPSPVASDEEEEDDEEDPHILNGSGFASMAALHKRVIADAEKLGWTVEVLKTSKASETGVIWLVYERNASKVAS